jgi:hypothetical protein
MKYIASAGIFRIASCSTRPSDQIYRLPLSFKPPLHVDISIPCSVLWLWFQCYNSSIGVEEGPCSLPKFWVPDNCAT